MTVARSAARNALPLDLREVYELDGGALMRADRNRKTGLKVGLGLSLVVGLLANVPVGAEAQTQEASDRYSVASSLGLNFAVPESPAFTVLGLNPEEVNRPATPRDFAAQIINGLDRDGNFQSGVAIELNPWAIANRNLLFGGVPLSADGGGGYADGIGTPFTPGEGFRPLRGLLYRTSLSFATAKASQSDNKAMRLAAGLRVTPWDPGDSRLLVGRCLVRRYKNFRGMVRTLTESSGAQGNYLAAGDEAALRMNAIVVPGADTVGTTLAQLRSLGLGPNHRQELLEAANEIASHLGIENRYPQDDDGDELLRELRALGTQAEPGVRRSTVDDVVKRAKNFAVIFDDYNSEKAKLQQGGGGAGLSANSAGRAAAGSASVRSVLSGLLSSAQADSPPRGTVAQQAARAAAKKMVEECTKEEEGRWNGSSWDISVAPSWISMDGSTGDLQWNGGAVWSSLAIGGDIVDLFERGRAVGDRPNDGEAHYFQLILHGRYRFEEKVMAMVSGDGAEAPTEQMVGRDTWLLGARLRTMFPRELFFTDAGISFEVSASNTDVSGKAMNMKDDTFWRFSLIPTLRLTENTWFDLSFGTETGAKGSDDAFILSAIKYGFGQAAFPSLSQSN